MSDRKPLMIEISPGELLDRISILQLKSRRIGDPDKRTIVNLQLAALLRVCQSLGNLSQVDPLRRELEQTNAAIWDAEEALRAREQAGDFGPRFIQNARRVYQCNDRRASLKRQIDRALGFAPGEIKSYGAGGARDVARWRNITL